MSSDAESVRTWLVAWLGERGTLPSRDELDGFNYLTGGVIDSFAVLDPGFGLAALGAHVQDRARDGPEFAGETGSVVGRAPRLAEEGVRGVESHQIVEFEDEHEREGRGGDGGGGEGESETCVCMARTAARAAPACAGS